MTPELRAIMERVDRVEDHSFHALYTSAPEELNAGVFEEDGVNVFWLASYEDAGFSVISGIDAASDRDATLERILQQLRDRGIRVVGLDDHPDFDPEIDGEWLAQRGFLPDFEEQIMWRSLEAVQPLEEPPGVQVVFAQDTDRDVFASVLNEGFGAPPEAGLGPIFANVIGEPGWLHYLVYVDDIPGAASALFIDDGVADFFVASTRPSARRRGAQTALINRRLIDSRNAGCDIATAQANAGNASARNFERHGFMPVYRRTIYSRRLDTPE